MSNQFEAAIRILRGWIHMPEPDNTQIANALRVLEAAGELTDKDKAWLLSKVDWAIAEYVPAIEGMVCPGAAMKDRFRALLKAIPREVTP